MKTKSDWKSVTNCLPAEDEYVLCYCESGNKLIICSSSDGWSVDISHWMKLPKFPIKIKNKIVVIQEKLSRSTSLQKTKYIPVPQWEKNHEWPPTSGLRNLIFNKHKNGFDKFGVVKKVGKRVLIDETAFFDWVAHEGKVK